METSALIYDGTMEGFFTCVFTAYEQKLKVTSISPETTAQAEIFSAAEVIITDHEKADRVKTALEKWISPAGRKRIYFAFLSEKPGIEMLLYQYIVKAIRNKKFSPDDFGDEVILKVTQIAKMVSREKHRMEAFVRFMLTEDDIYFAHITPDFNVLPIILPHFHSRFADQKWMIYDLKRKYGLFYDLNTTQYISLDLEEKLNNGVLDPSVYAASEKEFQILWQKYFKSVNIVSRKNTKLHLQHVPKRYWKYLSEKSSLSN